MGRVAERTGVRWTVIFGALMIAAGLVLSSLGGRWSLYVGHGLFMGLLGNAGINAPLYVYVARWFDRRRGSALALIASGQAVAGTIWAPLFGHAIQAFGWRYTMQLYAGFAVVVILPAAFLVFGRPARAVERRRHRGRAGAARRGPRAAAAHGARPDRAGELSVLRADGDAARPSGRLLRRSRHPGHPGCGDAVAAAWPAPLSAGSSGALSPTGSAGCARCSPARPVRRWPWPGFS